MTENKHYPPRWNHTLSVFKQILFANSIFLFCSSNLLAQSWDRNAGYIPSYTIHSTISTSSVGTGVTEMLVDGDLNTHWLSSPPLPYNYIATAHQNFLLNSANNWFSTIGLTDLSAATDGDTNSSTPSILNIEESPNVNIQFPNPQDIIVLTFKAQCSADIILEAVNTEGDTMLIGEYLAETENFSLKKFELSLTNIQSVNCHSKESFSVFEIAGLESAPKEFVTFDFGQNLPIGQVYTRHWAGDSIATATTLYISQDNQNWTAVASLNPNSLHPITTFLGDSLSARYLRLEHTLIPEDYKAALFWEVAVYDQDGMFGTRPTPQISKISLAEMLGINTVWGWNHNIYSNLLAEGEGPTLHNQWASHARNYHFMNWDVNDPDDAPDFETMAEGGGTNVHWWLNWDVEYQSWQDADLETITTLQFSSFQDTAWYTPFQSSKAYGRAFANHFGSTHGNGLVSTLEIGNEPWDYDTIPHQNILWGMAEGIKETDPDMEVFTCALQAHNPYAEHGSSQFRHYIGSRLVPDVAPYLDGINVHAYPFLFNDVGEQISVYPEHGASELQSVLNMIRFRDHNLPNKKIHLSEWGWDSDSPNEDCTHSECVSEQAAALYVVRAALQWLRLGIDKATYFFHANAEEEVSSRFTRSGLTESINYNFNKKKSFYAFQTLVDSLGNKHFIDVVSENDEFWAYLMGNEQGEITHLAIWRPIDGDDYKGVKFFWESDYKAVAALLIDGMPGGTPTTLPTLEDNRMQIEVFSTPTILTLTPNTCLENINLTTDCIYSNQYQAQNNISINAQLSEDLNIQAGQSVEINAGFEVPLGQSFEATIDECEEEETDN